MLTCLPTSTLGRSLPPGGAKELALLSFCSSLPHTLRVLVPSFPLFTENDWTIVLIFGQCSFLDTTIVATTSTKWSPPPRFSCTLLPNNTLGKGGLERSRLVFRLPHTRKDGALPLGCCSRVRRGAHFNGKSV